MTLTPITLISSITGFHNPKKHKGLKPEEFLLLYVRRQSKLLVNKKEDWRFVLISATLYDWEYWVNRIKRDFPNTFI